MSRICGWLFFSARPSSQSSSLPSYPALGSDLRGTPPPRLLLPPVRTRAGSNSSGGHLHESLEARGVQVGRLVGRSVNKAAQLRTIMRQSLHRGAGPIRKPTERIRAGFLFFLPSCDPGTVRSLVTEASDRQKAGRGRRCCCWQHPPQVTCEIHWSAGPVCSDHSWPHRSRRFDLSPVPD